MKMALVMDSVLRVVHQHVQMPLKSFSRSHTQDIQMTLVMRSVFRARCHKNVMASSSMSWAHPLMRVGLTIVSRVFCPNRGQAILAVLFCVCLFKIPKARRSVTAEPDAGYLRRFPTRFPSLDGIINVLLSLSVRQQCDKLTYT